MDSELMRLLKSENYRSSTAVLNRQMAISAYRPVGPPSGDWESSWGTNTWSLFARQGGESLQPGQCSFKRRSSNMPVGGHVPKIPPASSPAAMRIDGSFADWSFVAVVVRLDLIND